MLGSPWGVGQSKMQQKAKILLGLTLSVLLLGLFIRLERLDERATYVDEMLVYSGGSFFHDVRYQKWADFRRALKTSRDPQCTYAPLHLALIFKFTDSALPTMKELARARRVTVAIAFLGALAFIGLMREIRGRWDILGLLGLSLYWLSDPAVFHSTLSYPYVWTFTGVVFLAFAVAISTKHTVYALAGMGLAAALPWFHYQLVAPAAAAAVLIVWRCRRSVWVYIAAIGVAYSIWKLQVFIGPQKLTRGAIPTWIKQWARTHASNAIDILWMHWKQCTRWVFQVGQQSTAAGLTALLVLGWALWERTKTGLREQFWLLAYAASLPAALIAAYWLSYGTLAPTRHSLILMPSLLLLGAYFAPRAEPPRLVKMVALTLVGAIAVLAMGRHRDLSKDWGEALDESQVERWAEQYGTKTIVSPPSDFSVLERSLPNLRAKGFNFQAPQPRPTVLEPYKGKPFFFYTQYHRTWPAVDVWLRDFEVVPLVNIRSSYAYEVWPTPYINNDRYLVLCLPKGSPGKAR